jgi:choline-sulfatase
MESSAPYFLYAHFNDPHQPYRRRAPWYEPATDETRDAISRYDSEIRFMDESLARLYREMGWEENTVLVVVSDHGEELMQRGRMAHGFSLFDELNRVLMIVRAPGLVGLRDSSVNVSLVDVLPTVLDLAGIPPVEGRDGRSLDGLLPEGRPIFAHRGRASGTANLWAVIQGKWKLIVSDKDGSEQLFDLRADPGETVNVAGERAEVTSALRERLGEFSAAASASGQPVEVPLDEELFEQLESLGYVGGDD